MRFVLGGIIGLTMGLAITASAANLRWYSGTEMLTKSSEFQSGYVAGVYDGFTNARNLVSFGVDLKTDLQFEADQLDKYLACMNRNSDNLGDFRNWAILQWRSYKDSDKYSGAAVMLSNECTKTNP